MPEDGYIFKNQYFNSEQNMSKKILVSILSLTILLACNRGSRKAGDTDHPTLNSALVIMATDLKSKLPAGSTLAVVTSQRRPAVEEISERFSLKVVEIASPRISVVERKNLDKALEELQLQSSDTFDENQSVSIGKLLGAKYTIHVHAIPQRGSVKKLYNEEIGKTRPHVKVNLRLKAIEIETSKIIWAKESSFWHPVPRGRAMRRR
jgi:hypothetical protein